MPFQEKPGVLEWKVHFASPIEKVFEALTTDKGRGTFWAEKTQETNGWIEFNILHYPPYQAEILEITPPQTFRLVYFGTDTTFSLIQTADQGTDLHLKALIPNEPLKQEMAAGWASVLMAMKAAVDFGVDLRNHHPDRVWEKGYLDN
ncbi:MAG: SRPBCC domain-containing protein [Bacteroidota bacterium]